MQAHLKLAEPRIQIAYQRQALTPYCLWTSHDFPPHSPWLPERERQDICCAFIPVPRNGHTLSALSSNMKTSLLSTERRRAMFAASRALQLPSQPRTTLLLSNAARYGLR